MLFQNRLFSTRANKRNPCTHIYILLFVIGVWSVQQMVACFSGLAHWQSPRMSCVPSSTVQFPEEESLPQNEKKYSCTTREGQMETPASWNP